jgi:hypothetical protein
MQFKMRIYKLRKIFKNLYRGDEILEFTIQSANKKIKGSSDIEYLDDDIDDEGFIEGDITAGKVLSTFSFGMNTALSNDEASSIKPPVQENTDENFTAQNKKYTSAPKGLTPPIDSEYFTVKRSYAMRPSTVRKLNALKTEHPDVNVLFNTIIDMAINHYYNYIFTESGTFDN